MDHHHSLQDEWAHNSTDGSSVQLSLHDGTIKHSLYVLRLHVNNRFGPIPIDTNEENMVIVE